jgi:hypothetical protein
MPLATDQVAAAAERVRRQQTLAVLSRREQSAPD